MLGILFSLSIELGARVF